MHLILIIVSHMRTRTCLRFKVHLIGRALRSKVRVSCSAHSVVPFLQVELGLVQTLAAVLFYIYNVRVFL